jgi:hypothetical protein
MSSVNKSISVMWNGSSYATENIEFDPNVEEFIPSFNVNAAEFIPDSLPRNFGQATRNFFDGHRGDDLTKVNPPCVPVEVNVMSKKTKNLMPGLHDPVPRPGGGGHPRQPTNVWVSPTQKQCVSARRSSELMEQSSCMHRLNLAKRDLQL